MACLIVLTGIWASTALAYPTLFTNRCASCHSDDSPTCNGCHFHKGNLSANANADNYGPGDPVTVILDGGEEHGWIRGLLYDHNGLLVAIRTGPTGTGNDGGDGIVAFPVALEATAPMEVGEYVWEAAWFGGNTSGVGHTQSGRNVTIVVSPSTGLPGEGSSLPSSWGKIKALF